MRKGNIVVIPTQGFANRMRMIASAHVLAKHLNRSLFLHWKPEESCNIKFDQAFESHPFEFISFSEIQQSQYLFKGHVHTDTLIQDIEHSKEQYDYFVLQGGHEFKHPDMSVPDFIQNKHETYSSLTFHSSIINMFQGAQLPKKYIAVHFRSVVDKYDGQDIAQSPACAFHINSPIYKFFNIISHIHNPHDIPFVILSNTPEFLCQLQKQFPHHTFLSTNPSNSTDMSNRSDTLSMMHSIFDFYVLSKSIFIIGSYQSSFSDEPSFFNMVPKFIPLSKHLISNPQYHCFNYIPHHNLGVLNFNTTVYLNYLLSTSILQCHS
tara:strand:- start:61 stop:1023 length:963 start_codon:yes stop_codon:yes gene_type:complete